MKEEFGLLPLAFGLRSRGELVSFVGGGGKTSLMFALALALVARGQRVVATTTTRIFAAQMKLAPSVIQLTGDQAGSFPGPELAANLARFGLCLVVGEVQGDKVLGVAPDLPGAWLARPEVDFVLVEADGSRMRPIKAPADHEPVIPPPTTLLVPVVGIDALDGRIQDAAHRPELVVRLLRGSEQLAVSSEQFLTAPGIATLLIHPQGGLKGVPAQARVIPFINKVETDAQLPAAREIAHLTLHEPRIERVLIGAVKSDRPVNEVHQRVTAVVLAAGESKRMGRQTKQRLPWGDTTVLGQTLRNLKRTAVHDIVVVSGHEAEAVELIAKTERVPPIHNPGYAAGEMLSSLQTALKQLPPNTAAVLVVLADQPMVEPETMNLLLAAHWRGKGELIVPTYEGRRGNPVLIGRSHFAEMLALPAGAAPRDLLRRHQAELYLVPVDSDTILRDLDRPEDYEQWRPKRAAK